MLFLLTANGVSKAKEMESILVYTTLRQRQSLVLVRFLETSNPNFSFMGRMVRFANATRMEMTLSRLKAKELGDAQKRIPFCS